jgi:hypothetical protein
MEDLLDARKVYVLIALEIGGYGEDDYTIGVYSSEKVASDAFERWSSNQDFPDGYAKHIIEYNLDDLGEVV